MVKDTARCAAQIHPQDASMHGIEDGQIVSLNSRVGQINIAGISCNDLTDEMVLDELSSNAVLNGVPVKIKVIEWIAKKLLTSG